MSQDPIFQQRIAEVLKAQGVRAEHKRMFGGVAFMVNGNMAVGITNKGDFMVRFDGARHEEILQWPGAKPMTYGHGKMKGFLFVEPDAVTSRSALDKWVKLSLEYVKAMPKKSAKPAAKAASKKVAKAAAKKAAPKKKAAKRK